MDGLETAVHPALIDVRYLPFLLGLVAVGLFGWGYYQAVAVVPARSEGVLWDAGRPVRILPPGLHLVIPFKQQVTTLPLADHPLSELPREIEAGSSGRWSVRLTGLWRVENSWLFMQGVGDLEAAEPRVEAPLVEELSQSLSAGTLSTGPALALQDSLNRSLGPQGLAVAELVVVSVRRSSEN
ncbi:MAG: hypothetical protein HQL59_13365 [Magnetococcales bacterium]|nr:hypothetical protein [Magnetococcales bacterium]